jgi:FAD/FMN-containing dehydrogenase
VSKLSGRTLYPQSPGWDRARRNFCARIDYDQLVPRAVVFCQNCQDVVAAVRWARENGVPFRARSGRHSYEGYSVLAGGLVVDVSELDEISLDMDAGRARIGAGVFALDLHEQLYDVGVTIPAASGASVGIAGLALGGGFGVTSRKYGLTCDNVVKVELVTADGEVVTASEGEHSDLFWACKGGGGGNFGVVTAFEFKVNPIGMVGVCNITWPWEYFMAVVDAWQNWAPVAPNVLSTFLRLAVNGVITLFGQLTPDQPAELAGFSTLLRPMLDAAPPSGISVQVLPYSAAAAIFAGVDPSNPQWMIHPHNDQQPFKSTSAVATALFPQEALTLLKTKIEAAPPQTTWETNEPSMIQLLAGGGAPGDVPIDATAVPHRSAKFVLQYDTYWTDPADAERSVQWIESVRTAMLPYAGGAYVNYVDSTIPDYLQSYYGPNLPRLIQIKQTVDPQNIFSFPQSIRSG